MKNDHIKKPEGGLLSSQQWANFLRAEDKEVVTTETFFAVKQTIPHFGQYYYTPRFAPENKEQCEELITLGKKNSAAWVRVDASSPEQLKQLKCAGVSVKKAPHNMQPKENLIIDITATEEDLLSQMKGKTRYNIRLAKKKDVAVHFVTRSDEDFQKVFDLFFTMVEQTATRKGVHFHPKEHYQKMFETLPEESIALFAAEHGGGVFIAANIVTFCNGTATYLHGATADTHRNLMAPFLLQWSAIRTAKERGCLWYDFGGVFPESKDPGKAGITRFKKGFAPTDDFTEGQGSYDIILSPIKYKLYQFLQKLKGILQD